MGPCKMCGKRRMVLTLWSSTQAPATFRADTTANILSTTGIKHIQSTLYVPSRTESAVNQHVYSGLLCMPCSWYPEPFCRHPQKVRVVLRYLLARPAAN